MDIKLIRKKLHLSQEKFAEICGISRVYLSLLENNKIDNPGLKTIENIYDAIYKYIFFDNDVNNTLQFKILRKEE